MVYIHSVDKFDSNSYARLVNGYQGGGLTSCLWKRDSYLHSQ
jgi:hypothetical protein